MAVEDVRRRLLAATAALERHRVPYAVIGGHAVAVWVAQVEPDAVRNTVDVDVLLPREELARATVALADAGFEPAQPLGVPIFVERENPSPRRGVHVVFAGERVRPHEAHPAPDLVDVAVATEGFHVIGLLPLLVMKLTAFRDKDKVHVRDLLELELVTSEMEAALPADLRARLEWLRAHPE